MGSFGAVPVAYGERVLQRCRVIDERAARAAQHDAAAYERNRLVGHAERQPRVLLSEDEIEKAALGLTIAALDRWD